MQLMSLEKMFTTIANAWPGQSVNAYLLLPSGREAQRCQCTAHFSADGGPFGADRIVLILKTPRGPKTKMIVTAKEALAGPSGAVIRQRVEWLHEAHLETHGLGKTQVAPRKHHRLVRRARARARRPTVTHA